MSIGAAERRFCGRGAPLASGSGAAESCLVSARSIGVSRSMWASERLLTHDCSATRGTSGGPLLALRDDHWEVVGINMAVTAAANIALPVAALPEAPKPRPLSFPAQFLGACFDRMRCKVRRCILRRRAVSETLRSHSSNTRWMCSQRTRSADMGSSGGSGVPSSLGKQGPLDRVGIGRLRQIIDRPGLDRRDSCRDVAVAGQHDDAGARTGLLQCGDDIEPAAVTQPHVDNGESRQLIGRRGDPGGDAVGGRHDKAASLHCAREPLAQRCVVVNDQQRAFGFRKPL